MENYIDGYPLTHLLSAFVVYVCASTTTRRRAVYLSLSWNSIASLYLTAWPVAFRGVINFKFLSIYILFTVVFTNWAAMYQDFEVTAMRRVQVCMPREAFSVAHEVLWPLARRMNRTGLGLLFMHKLYTEIIRQVRFASSPTPYGFGIIQGAGLYAPRSVQRGPRGALAIGRGTNRTKLYSTINEKYLLDAQ